MNVHILTGLIICDLVISQELDLEQNLQNISIPNATQVQAQMFLYNS